MELIGDVTGKNVILVDDMVDTAGPYQSSRPNERKRSYFGSCDLYSCYTFCNAYEKIENSQLEELIVTDSIAPRISHNKVKVLSCARYLLK